jgi:hypothetical protein
MITSSGEGARTAVAIKRYVGAVGERLTSQVRGLFLVVGNGDGRKPLDSGLGIFGCGRWWADALDRSRVDAGSKGGP